MSASEIIPQTQTIVKTEIPFSTQYIQDPNLYVENRVILQQGVNGEKTSSPKQYSCDGKQTTIELFKTITKQPVDQIIAVGTKPFTTIKDNSGALIFPCNGEVTSTDKEGSHAGYTAIDVANSADTPIVAPCDGVITFAESYGGYGNCIQMASGRYSFLFGHLNSYNIQVGQEVRKGQIIGFMGSTGYSSGAHLHLEIYLDGVKQYIPNIFDLQMGENI